LLVSQFLTLFITPVYYVYIEGMRHRLSQRSAKPVRTSAAASHLPTGEPAH